jgi:branched-chain amino acid transport system permease protein
MSRLLPQALAASRGVLDGVPALRYVLVVGYIALTLGLVYRAPRSVLAFLLFESSLLVLYASRIPPRTRLALGAVVLGLLLPYVGTINGYYLEVATQVGIFVALALGLNIVVGLAGLLDLGYVAFYAVGAYLWAIFGSQQANQFMAWGHFPLAPGWFFVFLLLGVAVGAVTGILLGLPVLRLRGDYLAIVTLGFGEVIRVLANNLDNLTNGPKGITPIQRPPLFFQPALGALGIEASASLLYALYFYFLVLLIVGVVVVVNRRLEASHIGRAWEAIREDEVAATAMGIPLVRMKLAAFAAGASFAGIMGVVFASKQFFINPESFTLMESIGILAMVILGGMGSIPGAVLGASVVTVLNLQVLKGLSLWLNELRNSGLEILGYSLANLPTQLEPAKYERMIFGIILVAMMIFRPQGIIPARRRTRELRASREP